MPKSWLPIIKGLMWAGAALILAVAFLIQSTKDNRVAQLKKDTLAGCVRGNNLRRAENLRTDDMAKLRNYVVTFANDASFARAASGQQAVANRYQQIANQASGLNFSRVPLVNCARVFHQ